MNSLRHSAVVIFAALCFAGPLLARPPKGPVSFDGLYCCYVPTTAGVTTSYLRFYPDGVVIASISLGTPKDVVKWFNRQKQPNYHYTVRGNSIAFEEKTETLRYRYSGSIGSDSLALEVAGYDRAQKKEMGYVERTYKFIPFDSIR